MRAELVSLLSRCAGLLLGVCLLAHRTLAGMLFFGSCCISSWCFCMVIPTLSYGASCSGNEELFNNMLLCNKCCFADSMILYTQLCMAVKCSKTLINSSLVSSSLQLRARRYICKSEHTFNSRRRMLNTLHHLCIFITIGIVRI